jgi:UDP-N-acetylglucosamine 2-epimerase (non-hydrolysing)
LSPDWEAFGLIKPQAVVTLAGGTGEAKPLSAALAAAESLLESAKPQMVVLDGESDLALALALAAHKSLIPIARLDAGVRNLLQGHTREVSRALIDRLATHAFAAEISAVENLEREAIGSRCELAGNVLIDALVTALPRSVPPVDLLARHGLAASFLTAPAGYAVVDIQYGQAEQDGAFSEIANILAEISESLPLIWLAAPQTKARLDSLFAERRPERCAILPQPLYFETLALVSEAAAVITNSPAWQAETTAIGVPCITLAESTPRPVTVELGTNVLVKIDLLAIRQLVEKLQNGGGKSGRIPDKWDAKSAGRIVQSLGQWLKVNRPASVKARA